MNDSSPAINPAEPPPIMPIGDSVSTGIEGLDRIMHGGYPRGRSTLIRGASGSGKTLFSLMFALGIAKGEKVVFVSFDEPVEDLSDYIRHWPKCEDIRFLDFTVDPEDMTSGAEAADLAGLFVRLDYAVKETGARYLILDAFDALFDFIGREMNARQEIHKVLQWSRGRGLTLLATAGVRADYRAATSILDYACDCSILLEQNMTHGLMTRELRVLKLRGRGHGTNVYPFLIDEQGISVLPVTNITLDSRFSGKRLATGIAALDRMLGGEGLWQGSTTMISGQSGTGKSLLAASLATSACEQGYEVLYLSFEESPSNLVNHFVSAGVEFQPHLDAGRLNVVSRRAVELGLEAHLILILREVARLQAQVVVIDPISALLDLGGYKSFKNATLRLCSLLTEAGATVITTELLTDNSTDESDLNISSIVDAWITLSRVVQGHEMKRVIRIHKARGIATSGMLHDFIIDSTGIRID